MKVKEFNLNISKEIEDNLAEQYNNYVERVEEFEKQVGLQVIKSLANYKYCIIKNSQKKFIVGKVYSNCISIGSGTIIEFDNVKDIEKLASIGNELDNLAKISKM